jgi:YHS domain-containing protein
MATDPVCGMKVDESKAAAKAEYRGTAYYFCSTGCHKAFTAEPERYARQAPANEERSGEGPHGGR